MSKIIDFLTETALLNLLHQIIYFNIMSFNLLFMNVLKILRIRKKLCFFNHNWSNQLSCHTFIVSLFW